jgi:hypothetical protein
LNTGVTIDGRALTTSGNLATSTVTVTAPPGCIGLGFAPADTETEAATIYPNPFKNMTTITINDPALLNANAEVKIYDVAGQQVMVILIMNTSTVIEMASLAPGIYFYTIVNDHQTIQSGKLISQQ